jgi:hypothetical protein
MIFENPQALKQRITELTQRSPNIKITVFEDTSAFMSIDTGSVPRLSTVRIFSGTISSGCAIFRQWLNPGAVITLSRGKFGHNLVVDGFWYLAVAEHADADPDFGGFFAQPFEIELEIFGVGHPAFDGSNLL